MRLITDYAELERTPCVVALGMFDGVHVGHRAIIDTATEIAIAHNMTSVVHTFSNHPARVVRGSAPPLLTTPAEKARIVASLGAEVMLCPPFTKETARTGARAFADTLCDVTGAAHLVCGENYTFGSGQGGNAALLDKWAHARGVRVHVVPSISADGEPVSSTRVRAAVSDARFADAHAMLGRPFTFSGVVAHGRRVGRTLGVPTANIVADEGRLIPASGAYAAYIYTGVAYHRAVLNIGVNPTVAGTAGMASAALSIEGHLLDYRGVLYSRRVRVMPVRRLRDERRFASLDDLLAQIGRDIAQARLLLR